MSATALAPAPKPLTMAEAKVVELEACIVKREAEIEELSQQIHRANEVMHGTVRASSGSAASVDALLEDVERFHRRRQAARQLLEAEQFDLALARRQIAVDAINQTGAEFDAVMTQRTQGAHDLIAMLMMAAAKLEELDMLGRRGLAIIQRSTSITGFKSDWAHKTLNRVDYQAECEMTLASEIASNLWTSDGRRAKGTPSPLPNKVDAERRVILRELQFRAEAISRGEA